MYRAAAHASKSLEVDDCEFEAISISDQQALDFEARSAEVTSNLAMSNLKIVVKNTFFDVEESTEDWSSDDDRSNYDLPEAIFSSTDEIDEWRRDYRRFRLGHHHGAKGEVTAKNLAIASLAHLDLRTRATSRAYAA